MDECDDRRWAEEEFRDVDLGDTRLDRRLLDMAEAAARRPSGRITRVFDTPAAREAAFRFVENRRISPTEIGRASATATARRCPAGIVITPIDTTVLTVTDKDDVKGFGPVAGKHYNHRGAYVMSAIAVTQEGATLGLLGQLWWTRSHELVARGDEWKHDRRPLEQRESMNWLRAMRASARVLAEHSGARPWFQMDRGADSYSVLTEIIDKGWLATVRSSYDRRCEAGHLNNALASPTHQSSMSIELARSPRRRARTARVRLRATPTTVHAKFRFQPTRHLLFNLVEVYEPRPPRHEEPIHWKLLTTHPIETEEDVRAVVAAYTRRWNIETFHNAWKSGVTDVESSQLRHLEHFRVWATLLATVAARAERLKHRSRSEPDISALEEFTRDEVDAAILLRKPDGVQVGETPTLGQIVLWIAEYGGYTGKSSGGPPGTKVIARALIEVEAAARALASLRSTSG